MLQLDNLTKEFAGRELFRSISWQVNAGERVGLVGANGAGKSTLMRIIAGEVESSAGEIRMVRGATVGYLPQDGLVTRGRTLFAEALAALGDLQQMEEEIATLTSDLAHVPHDDPRHEALLERYGHLQEEFRLRGGYAKESVVGSVLAGLGFLPGDWERDCGEFSGGWQMRIALARLLLKKPNVLLLDEPTNHLDIDTIVWLEEFLLKQVKTFLFLLFGNNERFFQKLGQRI